MKKCVLLLLGIVFGMSLVWAGNEGVIGTAEHKWIGPGESSSKLLPGGPIIPTRDEILLWRAINEVRADPAGAGWPQYPPAPPLQMNYQMTDAARFHSQEMIDNNYFDHDSKYKNGHSYENAFERIERFGYDTEGALGENIAGCGTVSTAMDLWLHSTGHRENIMRKEYSEIGIGIKNGGPYGKMFTTDFGFRSIQFDLAITDPDSDLWWRPEGNTIIISAMVTNLGKTHAFPVYVAFYDGDPQQGGMLVAPPESIPAIVPNDEKALAEARWVPASGGLHQIFVVVDPNDRFNESNENNNSASLPVMLGIEEPIGSEPIAPFVECLPNPSGARTEIAYAVNTVGPVSLAIYNSSGQLVKMLTNGEKTPGGYRVVWTGENDLGQTVPAGIYFVRLVTPESRLVKKVIRLVK